MAATDQVVEGLGLVLGRQLLDIIDGQRIREAAGLSRAELAAMVETSPVNVWRWERTGRRPRGALARRYLAVLVVLLKAVSE